VEFLCAWCLHELCDECNPSTAVGNVHQCSPSAMSRNVDDSNIDSDLVNISTIVTVVDGKTHVSGHGRGSMGSSSTTDRVVAGGGGPPAPAMPAVAPYQSPDFKGQEGPETNDDDDDSDDEDAEEYECADWVRAMCRCCIAS